MARGEWVDSTCWVGGRWDVGEILQIAGASTAMVKESRRRERGESGGVGGFVGGPFEALRVNLGLWGGRGVEVPI